MPEDYNETLIAGSGMTRFAPESGHRDKLSRLSSHAHLFVRCVLNAPASGSRLAVKVFAPTDGIHAATTLLDRDYGPVSVLRAAIRTLRLEANLTLNLFAKSKCLDPT